jgi:hypothetical protein
MKCYNHPATDGVAVCKSCGRAICHDCCAEVETSCACKGKCEVEVGESNVMPKRGRSVYQKRGTANLMTSSILVLIGLTLACIGAFRFLVQNDATAMMNIVIGSLLIVCGCQIFRPQSSSRN